MSFEIKQQYIAKSRYARYLPEEQRRESWSETVDRYIKFWQDRGQLGDKDAAELTSAIVNLEVMPSMRCLMTAGPALERDNVAGFNCSYLPIDSPRAFDELMYILLCGTGVGFSVESQYVSKFPKVAEVFEDTDTVIDVSDSKVGWAKALRELVSLLYIGCVPKINYDRIRPAGAPLKTFGGRASGPEPLRELFDFVIEKFTGAAGRKLTDLECNDICCKIGAVVVVGGVRRSAEISLSDLSSDGMRTAKSGAWWDQHGHRALANNSAVYEAKPTPAIFLKEWTSLYESYSGERGFFSRAASQKQAAKNGRRDPDHAFGTNPCSEIILRPHQFCNLSEVVIRPTDTLPDLKRKVQLATILGTLQATLTDFRYLRKIWKDNTEEEALLGVSFTGIMDHSVMSGINEPVILEDWLKALKEVAVDTNKKWAKKLGINQSAAITCVKPSGTVSQLVDSASGIHPRYADYYIRRVRADSKDPLSTVLQDAGIPWEYVKGGESQVVFTFYDKAPEGALTVPQTDGVQMLKVWKMYQDYWCEHKPSVTIYYTDDNFIEIGSWLYENFDDVSGVSFLPYDGHVYEQAPYEPITKEQYEEAMKDYPTAVNWNITEESDVTEGSQELACTGGSCDLP